MNISLNGIENPDGLITFNHIPTIVRVDSLMTIGKKRYVEFQCGAASNPTQAQDMYVNGTAIGFSTDYSRAVNSIAYLTSLNGTPYNEAMAFYLAKALSSTVIANDYDVSYNGGTVRMISKKYGQNEIEVENVPEGWHWTRGYTNPSAPFYNNDELADSIVVLKLSIQDNESRLNTLKTCCQYTDKEHVITLEKNYYKDGIEFDISPILGNYTNYESMVEYSVDLSYVKNGQYKTIGSFSHCFSVNGYLIDDGKLFIPKLTTDLLVAQEIDKGETTSYLNNTRLYYVDGEECTLSMFVGDRRENINYFIRYYDSADELINQDSRTQTNNSNITTLRFTPNNQNAHYIVVSVTGLGSIRYDNIKPLKYGNNKEYQSLYWCNEYGGVSFFPFTAQRKEDFNTNYEIYRKQNFDLYRGGTRESGLVYSNDINHTLTLKSHYMDINGKYLFESLVHTYRAWIKMKDYKQYVGIDDITLDEIQPNVYQITVKISYKTI